MQVIQHKLPVSGMSCEMQREYPHDTVASLASRCVFYVHGSFRLTSASSHQEDSNLDSIYSMYIESGVFDVSEGRDHPGW